MKTITYQNLYKYMKGRSMSRIHRYQYQFLKLKNYNICTLRSQTRKGEIGRWRGAVSIRTEANEMETKSNAKNQLNEKLSQ